MTTAVKTRKSRKQTTTPKLSTARKPTTSRIAVGTTASHSRMHQDHLQWMNDSAMWQDDLVEWQTEIRRIRLELKQLDYFLEKHSHELFSHLEGLLALRASLREHEHEIARYEQGGKGEERLTDTRTHHEESKKQAQQQACHDNFKRHHHTIVTQWDRLHKVFNELSKP